MTYRVTTLLVALLIVVGLFSGCGTPTPQLEMEVSTLGTARVGEYAVVRVIFRNLPLEGGDIDMAWYGFGIEDGPIDWTIGLPSLPGACGDPKKMSLLWESSNAGILEGPMEPPDTNLLDDADLPPDTRNLRFEFFFKALSAGTTDLKLTLTRPDGSVIERAVEVTVVE